MLRRYDIQGSQEKLKSREDQKKRQKIQGESKKDNKSREGPEKREQNPGRSNIRGYSFFWSNAKPEIRFRNSPGNLPLPDKEAPEIFPRIIQYNLNKVGLAIMNRRKLVLFSRVLIIRDGTYANIFA